MHPLDRPRPAARRLAGCVAAVAASLALLGAACSTGDRSSSTTASTPPSTAAVVESDTAPPVELVRTGVELHQPIALEVVPGTSSVLIATKQGLVHEAIAVDGDLEVIDEPVLDLTDLVGEAEGEQGLLGLAVHPDGDRIYASYTASGDGGASRLDRYELTGTPGSLAASIDSRVNLLDVEQPYENHNGGHVTFGPDGMLYLGLGDGGSGGDPEGNAQDRSSLLGKILRLDPDATGPDDVAADGNPFSLDGDDASEGRPEIWSTGARNPWRFSFDRMTGDLWIADVGQDRYEEIDLLPADEGAGRGANLGWDLYEGDEPFDEPDPAPGAASAGPFVQPVFTYARDEGCSITGGVVYRGSAIPELDGAYLFADHCTPGLRAIRVGDTVESLRLGDDLESAVSFSEGADGEVYAISLWSGIFRLTPG